MTEIARIYLPQPVREYSQDFERKRSARIEDLIRGRLPIDKPSVYGGTPHASLKGTNAAFAVTGALGTLPFNTVNVNDSSMVVGTDIKIPYVSDVRVDLNMFVTVTAAGISRVTVQVLAGATLLYALTQGMTVDAGELYTLGLIVPAVLSLQVLFIKVSCTKNLTVDMTKSFMWVTMLNQNPKLSELDRL